MTKYVFYFIVVKYYHLDMAKQDYINAIASCPELQILPHTARGNFMLFLINWIRAGCKPIDVTQLQIPIGMKDDVWNRYKSSVNSVAKVIMPELRQIYDNRANAYEGRAKWVKMKKIEKLKQSTLSDSDILHEQDYRPRKFSKNLLVEAQKQHGKQPVDTSSEGMMQD